MAQGAHDRLLTDNVGKRARTVFAVEGLSAGGHRGQSTLGRGPLR
jgi:hypothetical protein